MAPALDQSTAARLHYQEGLSRAPEPESQSHWALGWLIRGARQLGQQQLAERFDAAKRAQAKAEDDAHLQGALLPDRAIDAGLRTRAA